MKKIFITLLVFGYVFCAMGQSHSVTIKKVSAKDVKAIIDTSTKPLIVNFWATWCGPCVREIPWFDSIIKQKKAPVKLLLVSLDFKNDYPKKLADFVQKRGYNGEVVFLSETNSASYIATIEPKWKGGIPASIFIDNSKKYYQVYNQQLPKQKFAMELDKMLIEK